MPKLKFDHLRINEYEKESFGLNFKNYINNNEEQSFNYK